MSIGTWWVAENVDGTWKALGCDVPPPKTDDKGSSAIIVQYGRPSDVVAWWSEMNGGVKPWTSS